MRSLTGLLLGFFAFTMTFAAPASARVQRFPPGFHMQRIKTDGATIYVRVGGKGPAVVLLHGFGDTGDMWAPAAKALYKDHTVIVPDLRGMGLSSQPERRLRQENARPGHRQGHGRAQDRQGRSGHPRHRQHGRLCARRAISGRITKWVIIDAPLPGIGPWDEILKARCSGISISADRMSTAW